ncbi:hypothetical protein HG826_27730 [Streptomyces sp. GMY01]|uniref:MAE_28990/MAE_18760 family HEPN-like nuclease n=1 Tax=Streptomyces sp. GMY02 TaxID=1333528 RepID=UPI00146C65C6|nr:MAE_28990/MAE_18760 family HEPN-like nuclease [Streptomyces sp. GMY02]NMO37306.1 hypothetical protein [Streptomyces sp. GMY02]
MRDNYLSLLAGSSELHQQLKLLRSLRKFGRIAKDTFTEHPQSDWLAELHETATGTAGLQSFYYGATIVRLYGLLERFVEETLAESVRRIASMAPSYSSLPEGIRNNHLPLTLEVLGKLSTNKYQGKIDEASLVEKLHSCLSQNGSFSLNDIVFAHHTANFRDEVVRQSFERIGVRMQKLESSALMNEAMSQHFPEEANPFFVIDDLAERRYEVSHGAASQLLSAEILDSYISIIESYARAVLDAVTSWLILFAVPNIGIELGRPDRVFRHRIA